MKTLYKLTDKNGYTRKGESNETLWTEGVTYAAEAGKPILCTGTVIHAYVCPRLAVLMNPIHANINCPRLWECEGEIAIDDGLKVGVKTLTAIREIALPICNWEHRVRFGIFCALQVYQDAAFVKWANGWLDGSDQSRAVVACAAARAAASAVSVSAADAVSAAYAAAHAAADAASAAYAAYAAAYAAYAAADAAYAAYAAYAAAHTSCAEAAKKINFIELAAQAFGDAK